MANTTHTEDTVYNQGAVGNDLFLLSLHLYSPPRIKTESDEHRIMAITKHTTKRVGRLRLQLAKATCMGDRFLYCL